MARIKMTRGRRLVLYFLEFYVVVMLALIFVRFLRVF
jgi:hypothetical protein